MIYVKIPLQELCKRLSVRDLIKIAKTYDICVNKNKQSRYEMAEKIAEYATLHKVLIGSIFKPIADQPVREKVRKHRLQKRKCDSTFDVEANKRACKKWRSSQSFPPKPPSADKTKKIIQRFVQDSKFEAIHEKGCAVCGCLSTAKDMILLANCHLDLSMLVRPHVTKEEHRLDNSIIPNQQGPVLAPDCDSVCAHCFNVLSRHRMPRNALANGLWLGEVPPELQGLSWMEQKLIAKINVSRAIVRVKESKLMQMKTNVVCRASPTKHIHKVLPPKISEFEDVMAIIFLGPNPPTPKKYQRTPLLVRRAKVATALEWLKLNHADYSDLTISYENLNEYPEDTPPVVVDYHMVEHDDINDPESTAVNTTDNEDSTSEGESTMIVHGLVGDELTELWDKDDQQTIRFKAMKHLRESGKVMAIKLSDELESLWHNPQLYPSMFPWLFPYGYGGLGNDRIKLNLSDAVRKKNWLQYYDKRFQHDKIFALVAFNHQQIKKSSDGGYFLTLKKNFPTVIDRLTNISMSTLNSLIERTEKGRVTPETDSEKECFRLLGDIEYVASNVDGSVSNRRRMRSEIQSLTCYLGAPSWFITFAPADVKHPIALYYASDNLTYYPSFLEKNERTRLIANNPVAGAKFFKFMVDMFIKHVLGYAHERNGFYGKTSGYYGTVEQQGRLTLHMHMLIWLKHSLTPQQIRDNILDPNSDFQTKWLNTWSLYIRENLSTQVWKI